MTTCERYQPWMVEALYGELDDARRVELEAHAGDCAECAALFAELQTTAGLMSRRRRPDPGPEFWDGYARRLQERMENEDAVVDSSRFARRRSLGSWGYRVAAVVAIMAAGMWIGRTVLAPRPGTEAPAVAVDATHEDTTRGTSDPVDPGAGEAVARGPAAPAPQDDADARGTRAPMPIDPTPGETASRDPRPAGDAVLVSDSDARQYIERSQLLLLAVLNGDPEDPAYFDAQRTRAGELVRTASAVREGSDDRRVRELVTQLEFILREIAHLEEGSDVEAVELIRSRVDREGVLLRINLEQMRAPGPAPASSTGPID